MEEEFVMQLRAVSDPTRLRILKLLEAGELCVCDIMAVLQIKQPTASKHLGVLKNASLVESRKEKTWSYFRLSGRKRGQNRDILMFVRKRLNEDDSINKDRRLLGERTHLRKIGGGCG